MEYQNYKRKGRSSKETLLPLKKYCPIKEGIPVIPIYSRSIKLSLMLRNKLKGPTVPSD